MIKVLHYGISENRGGIETYLYKLWKNIDRTKFHFDFIDTNLGKPCFYDEFREMGSRFFKITPRKKSLYKNKKDLEKLFKEEKFDILHCHLNTFSYIEPIKIALKYKCKVIIHSRNSGASKSLITNIMHFTNFIFLNHFNITKLAVSDKAGRWLFGNKKDYKIINNSVDINNFRFDLKSRNKTRKKLNIENKFVIGNVGAFVFAKNHEFILKIMSEILKIKNNSVLLLVGEGHLKNKIQNLSKEMNIEDKVLFLGSRSNIPDLLSAMDVLVFPSIYEGFPNAVLEAQTSGLPCYISDSITPEIVVLNNCFRLSLNIEASEWAKKIINKEVVEKREEAYKIIEKKGFSIEKEISVIEEIYNSILD